MSDFSFPNVTWTQFELCNENQRDSFEDMCWELFHIVMLKEAEVPHADHNNPGVEVYPVLEPVREGGKPQRRVSFQAKYFSKNVSYKQIKESLNKTISTYKNKLDHIYLFCNQTLTITSKGYIETEKIVKNAGITLQPVSNQAILNLVKEHPDIAKYYFSQRKIVDSNLYHRLMKRFSDQYSGHPSIKMMTPDQMLFPRGLPAITNTERQAKEGNLEPSTIKEMVLKSWEYPERKHILFVGEGGIGKTVAMLMLPEEDWFLNYKIPVIYIPLQKLDAFDGRLNDYICHEYINEINGINELSSYACKDRPNLIILLDGFNEIPMEYKQTAEKHILLWMDKPGVQIITTSRISFSLNRRFLEYTLLPLPYKTIKKYLLSAGFSKNSLPPQSHHIWKIINVPLMLTMFIKIDKVKGRTIDSSISEYLEWKESDNAAHIIWNYLQVELYRLISTDESASVLSATAILAIAPYVCYEMAKKRKFYVEQEEYQEFIRKATIFYSKNESLFPRQIKKIQYRFDNRKKIQPFKNNAWENYLILLSNQLVLFQDEVREKEIIAGDTDFEIVFTPIHQTFRDTLAAIFISECMLNIRRTGGRQNFLSEILDAADYYVKNYISEFLSDKELQEIWEYHRINEPEKGNVTWTLMDIIGRKREYDYSQLNFSSLNLTSINLHRLLSRKQNICPLPQKAELFNNTKVTLKNLYSDGHTSRVTSVSFSNDGKHLISGSFDGTIRIWNLESGSSLRLDGHTDKVTSVAFSQDGKRIASGSYDKTVRIWEIESGKNYVLQSHTGPVTSVAFSRDGSQLVSGSHDRTVRIWDFKSNTSKLLEGHIGPITCVAFNSDGSQLVSGSYDRTVRLWNIKSGVNKILKEHTGMVTGVAFSSDGSQLASGSLDQTIQKWDLGNGLSRVFEGHKGPVTSITFSPDGRLLASGLFNKKVQIWDMESGSDRLFEGHTATITSVMFSPDGRQLATGSDDCTVRIWDVENGSSQILKGRTGWVNSLEFSPDGSKLAGGSYDCTVRIWNLKNDKGLVLDGHKGPVTGISFSPDGLYLASCSNDHTIQIWHLEKGKNWKLEGHAGTVTSISFSPDRVSVASGSDDHTIRIWNIENNRSRVLEGHKGAITSISFSPDGKYLVSSSYDRTVRIWDLKSNKEKQLINNAKLVTSVAFSPDGTLIAIGSFDKSVQIWGLERDGAWKPKSLKRTGIDGTHKLNDMLLNDFLSDSVVQIENHRSDSMKVLKECAGWITTVAFSPVGFKLASGSFYRVLRIWDLNSNSIRRGENYKLPAENEKVNLNGKQIIANSSDNMVQVWDFENDASYTLEGHTDGISCVTFSPNGRLLASGSNDSTVRIWDLSTGKQIKQYRVINNINLIGANFEKASLTEDDRIKLRETGAKA